MRETEILNCGNVILRAPRHSNRQKQRVKKRKKKNKMKKFIKKKVLKIRSGLRFGDAEISRFT